MDRPVADSLLADLHPFPLVHLPSLHPLVVLNLEAAAEEEAAADFHLVAAGRVEWLEAR